MRLYKGVTEDVHILSHHRLLKNIYQRTFEYHYFGHD